MELSSLQTDRLLDILERAVEMLESGQRPATELVPDSETVSITPDSHSAALGQVDTTPETQESSQSDPPDTPTFRVEVDCESVLRWVQQGVDRWELRCSHGALWAYVGIHAPDVDRAMLICPSAASPTSPDS